MTHSQNNMEVCSQPEITNTRSQPCLRAIVGPYLCGIHTCHLQLETACPQLSACMVILYLSLTACSHTIYNCFVSTSKLCMLMQKGALKSTLSSEMDNALSGARVILRPHASRCRELSACLLHAGQRAAGGRDVKALAGRCQRGTSPRRAVLRLQVQAPGELCHASHAHMIAGSLQDAQRMHSLALAARCRLA